LSNLCMGSTVSKESRKRGHQRVERVLKMRTEREGGDHTRERSQRAVERERLGGMEMIYIEFDTCITITSCEPQGSKCWEKARKKIKVRSSESPATGKKNHSQRQKRRRRSALRKDIKKPHKLPVLKSPPKINNKVKRDRL